MSKVRVYEVAKQLNLDPKAVVALFQAVGINDVRNHMSSVEPEAVERVKRHLEKQRTHNVVEERIRPTVLKRRAVAKPDNAAAPSVPALPSSPLSSHDLSALDAEQNGHGYSDPPRERDVPPPAPSGRPSTRDVSSVPPASIPEERKSVRDLSSLPPVPAERKSTRAR